MKIFGRWSELVNLIFRKDTRNVTIQPSSSVTYTADRVVELPAQDAPSVLVSRDSTDTLTNKTMTAPVLNAAVINGATTLSVDDSSSAFNLLIASTSGLTADRTVTLDANDGNRTVSLEGNLSTAGAFDITVTATATTSVTLPTSGTLSTLAGSETLSNKTLASPIITTQAQLNAQAPVKFGDSDSSNFASLRAPATITSDYTLTLPVDDGAVNQVLQTDGSGNLSWVSVTTTALPEDNVNIGDSSNAAANIDTNLLGDIKAYAKEVTFVPGDVNTGTLEITVTAHGLVDQDIIYLTSSGTLPDPLAPSTTYYAAVLDANTIRICADKPDSALNNPIVLTDAGSGTHTLHTGGLKIKNYPLAMDGTDPANGYLGHSVESATTVLQSAGASGSFTTLDSINLYPGKYLIYASVDLVQFGSTLLANGSIQACVGLVAASDSGCLNGIELSRCLIPAAQTGDYYCTLVVNRPPVVISTSTTFYLNARVDYTAGTPQWLGHIYAVAIN